MAGGGGVQARDRGSERQREQSRGRTATRKNGVETRGERFSNRRRGCRLSESEKSRHTG